MDSPKKHILNKEVLPLPTHTAPAATILKGSIDREMKSWISCIQSLREELKNLLILQSRLRAILLLVKSFHPGM